MAEHQQAIQTLTECSEILNTCRQESMGISKDPHVLQWQKVNINSFMPVINALGMPTKLHEARDRYPGLARELLDAVVKQENNINNLLAAIKHDDKDENSTSKEASIISSNCEDVLPLLIELQHCRGELQQASITLQENLSITTLLPLAREHLSGKKRNLFDSGYEIYLTITDDQDTEIATTNLTNMYDFIEQIASRQKTLEAYEPPPSLPPIIIGMIDQQFSLCKDGFLEVKQAINLINSHFGKELANFQKFQDRLEALKKKNVVIILQNAPGMAEELSACLRNFSAKKFIMQELSKTEQLLENCEKFYSAIINNFIPYLCKEISSENNILNPLTMAQSRAKSYFKGLRGLWRIIRMMLYSFVGPTSISPLKLEEKLHQKIADCHIFFRQESHNAVAMQDYITTSFEEYNYPFPAAELTELLQKSLLTYSAILQKVFHRYRPARQELEKKPPTMGRLSSKIEMGIDYFKKYQKKSEKMLS